MGLISIDKFIELKNINMILDKTCIYKPNDKALKLVPLANRKNYLQIT